MTDQPTRLTIYDRKDRVTAAYQLTPIEGEPRKFRQTLIVHLNYGSFLGPARRMLGFADGHEESVEAWAARMKGAEGE